MVRNRYKKEELVRGQLEGLDGADILVYRNQD